MKLNNHSFKAENAFRHKNLASLSTYPKEFSSHILGYKDDEPSRLISYPYNLWSTHSYSMVPGTRVSPTHELRSNR